MMGGTLPIPLYRFWAPEMHFGSIATTLIFAVYAVGVVVSLVTLPSLSDQLGRRPVLAAALIVLAATTLEFLWATSLTDLLIARFVFGIGAGVVTTTANAALAELAGEERGRLAAQMSTASNMGGLGLGGLAAGLLARWATDPTHLVFWLYFGALIVGILMLVAVPETVTRRGNFRLEVRRPALPDGRERGRSCAFWLLSSRSSPSMGCSHRWCPTSSRPAWGSPTSRSCPQS
jgi:MFS family permease